MLRTGDALALSSSDPFPGAAYAPYADKSYVWNPFGSGLSRQRMKVPVLLVSNETAADARRRAAANNEKVGRARRVGQGTPPCGFDM